MDCVNTKQKFRVPTEIWIRNKSIEIIVNVRSNYEVSSKFLP